MTTSQAHLAEKLHPSRFTAMSGKMAALVGYIINEPFTDPAITGLIVDTSGGVLASTSEDPLFDQFLGSVEDLRRNWTTLLDAAELTGPERTLAEYHYAQRVRYA